MDREHPRITSVMGVARALLTSLDPDEAVTVLLAEFGWDVTFHALSLLHGPEAETAFARCWESLLLAPYEPELPELGPPRSDQTSDRPSDAF